MRGRPHPGLLPTGRNQKLHIVEELLVAFMDVHEAHRPTTVGITLKLVDRRFEGGSQRRALGLHHHDGDAVEKQDNVRDDGLVGLALRAGQPKLAHGPEGVVLGMFPIHKVDGAPAALLPAFHPVDHGAAKQQRRRRLVGLQQPRGAEPLQRIDRLRQSALVQPGFALGVQVDTGEGLPQVVFEYHLTKALSPGVGRVVRIARGDAPAHACKLIEEWLLHVGKLSVHPCPPPVTLSPGATAPSKT
jgi:hypothetical protein